MVLPDLNCSPPETQEEQILQIDGNAIDEDAVPAMDEDGDAMDEAVPENGAAIDEDAVTAMDEDAVPENNEDVGA